MTTVTSATPSTIKLTVGGTAQTVLLGGTMMNDITSAHVEQNGAKLNSIQATVLPSTGATQREVRLTALSGAQPNTTPLTLIVLARVAITSVPVPTPLSLTVVLPTVLVHRDQLFGAAISAVLQGATTSFTSCGVPADHVFSVFMPNSPYSVNGTVPRLEQQTTVGERATFLATHSINPGSVFNPQAFTSFGTTGHPSPFPHSVAEVRNCLEPFSVSNWAFTGATQANITVTVKASMATFRARGMPSDPLGAFTALNVGIGWGDLVTDLELPDYTYILPQFEIQLPVTVSGGKITYGSVQFTLQQQAKGWQKTFLGPGSVQTQMEQYAAARMTQIGQELRKAFDSGNTRAAITNRIANQLQSGQGISNVVGITLTTGNMWEIQYK
jgi:hypothetical protein